MRKIEGTAPCPCGSRTGGAGNTYEVCCRPLHLGSPAATAERLMRSRYSAFVLGDAEHLLRSWAPETRPRELELDPGVEWRRLIVQDVRGGGPEDLDGYVTFIAVGRTARGRFDQRERSRFVRLGDEARWYYVDGTELP